MIKDFNYEAYCFKNNSFGLAQKILNSQELEEVLKLEIMPIHYYLLLVKICEEDMLYEDFFIGEITITNLVLPLIALDKDAFDMAQVCLDNKIRDRLKQYNEKKILSKLTIDETFLMYCDSFEMTIKYASEALSTPINLAISACEAGCLASYGAIKGAETLINPELFYFWAKDKGFSFPEKFIPFLTSAPLQDTNKTTVEKTQLRTPGGSNPDTPRMEATIKACEAVFASINSYLDNNGKIKKEVFDDAVKQALLNQKKSPEDFHGTACANFWKNATMQQYRKPRGRPKNKK